MNRSDTAGQTVLLIACSPLSRPDNTLIEALFNAGADVNAQDNLGRTALIESVAADRPDLVALLLSHGADWRLRDKSGRDAVYYASFSNRLRIGQLLAQEGAQLTIFQAAALGFDQQVVSLLTADPSLANRFDESGCTALQWAAVHHHMSTVSLILSYRPTLDVFSAAASGQTRDLQAMLKRDPRTANASDGRGLTPLNWAVGAGNYDAAQILLATGADPNPMHQSPLVSAIRAGNIDLVELLLKFGADKSKFYPGFGTPRTIALSIGRKDIAALLGPDRKENTSVRRVRRVSGAVVGIVLLLASLGKMFAFRSFARRVYSYGLLPVRSVPPAALLIVLAELLVGLALMLGLFAPWSAYGAIALLGIFSGAIAVNVLRGRRDVECGCSGFWGRTKLGWQLAGRNFGFIGLAAISTSLRWNRSVDFILLSFSVLVALIVLTILLDWNRNRYLRHTRPAQA